MTTLSEKNGNTRCWASYDIGTRMDANNSDTTVGTRAGRGTIFAGRIASQLWSDVLIRTRSEVVEVSPDRWLALPIKLSADDLAFYQGTGQGWATPLEAALSALAFAPGGETAPRETTTWRPPEPKRKLIRADEPSLF